LKNQLNQVKQELLGTQQAFNNQSSEINCSHSDYNQLKVEIVRIQKDKERKEKEIITKFITEFNLNQEQNNTIKQIINTIKSMLDKPPIEREIEVENTERIQELEKEIESLRNTPFGENLATIKQLELNSLEHLFKKEIDTNTIQQIQQATSYQQVVATRQSFLEKNLNKKEQEIKPLELVNPPELIQPVNKERIV
jgi:hypothetical protein